MRILIQRVREARVTVSGRTAGAIGVGLLALVGFSREDGPELPGSPAWERALGRLCEMRIFPDPEDRMKLSLTEWGGELLLVPQFTLYADLGKGRRMRVASVTSFEDLWAELTRMKRRGEEAFVGCCCQPFFAKHVDDFAKAGVPGILVDIDNTTCYDLDQAREAYAGTFESQTTLHLELLASVLEAAHGREIRL